MKKYILTLFIIIAWGGLHAHELSGTVTSEDTKALEGVGVYNKTTGGYTYTNVSGYFELDNISAGDVIRFYSLGYKTQQVTVAEDQLDGTGQYYHDRIGGIPRSGGLGL